MTMLSVFRAALRAVNRDEDSEVVFTVDDRHPSGFVLDPETESESTPLINCVVDGFTVNIPLSAFQDRADPELDAGVFRLRDDDGIVREIRFYAMLQLMFNGGRP